MTRYIIPAALAALIAGAAGASAQQSTITEPPSAAQSSPATGPGETTETGQVEIQAQMTDDPIERVQPGVGAEESADAMAQQAATANGPVIVVPAPAN